MNKICVLLYTFIMNQENPCKRHRNSNCILHLVHCSLLVKICVSASSHYVPLHHIYMYVKYMKISNALGIIHSSGQDVFTEKLYVFQRFIRNTFMSLFPSVLVLFQKEAIASFIHNLLWLCVVVPKGFWQKVVLMWKGFWLVVAGGSCWSLRHWIPRCS